MGPLCSRYTETELHDYKAPWAELKFHVPNLVPPPTHHATGLWVVLLLGGLLSEIMLQKRQLWNLKLLKRCARKDTFGTHNF